MSSRCFLSLGGKGQPSFLSFGSLKSEVRVPNSPIGLSLLFNDPLVILLLFSLF